VPEPRRSLAAVTVVFEAEVPLLELQARSIARHLHDGVFDEYLVIDNTRRGLSPRARRRIRAELGSHGARLDFISRSAFGTAPTTSGWRSQQSLKLMAARRLTADHYVVLDAKNHFIEPTTRADFLDSASGLPHGGIHSFERHPLRPQLEHVAAALGIDPASVIERFTATAPPVVLDRRVVNEIVDDVGGGTPDLFPAEFERAGFTEFFLYSAWQIARGATLDDLVSGRSLVSPTVWVGASSPEDVRAVLEHADRSHTTTLAVHRRALARLNSESVQELAGFWTRHGLFRSSAEARRFIRRFRIVYVRSMVARRVRERFSLNRSLTGRGVRAHVAAGAARS
jgi:hypothetical protein